MQPELQAHLDACSAAIEADTRGAAVGWVDDVLSRLRAWDDEDGAWQQVGRALDGRTDELRPVLLEVMERFVRDSLALRLRGDVTISAFLIELDKMLEGPEVDAAMKDRIRAIVGRG